MGSIVEFTAGDIAFDPQTIEAMSTALDEVCEKLNISGQATAREIIAIRIVEFARRGERNPIKLRELVLADLNESSGC